MGTDKRIRERARFTATLSQAARESEIRAIARKFSHCSAVDVVQIIREKTGVAADPAFVARVLSEVAS